MTTIDRTLGFIRREAFLEFAEVVIKCDSGELLNIRRALAKEFQGVLMADTRRYFGLKMAIAVVRAENEARMEENL